MHSLTQFVSAIAAVAIGSSMAMPTLSANEIAQVKRAPQAPFDGLPACNSKDTDPTWAVGQSAFQDGEGVRIGDDCDNNTGGDYHCWTDYFLVGTTKAYQTWTMGNTINCDTADKDCHLENSHGESHCTSFTSTVSDKISAEFGSEAAKLGFEITVTQESTKQTCSNSSETHACAWTDLGCHALWTAPRIMTVHGYKRRNCASPTSDPAANMPNTQRRPDGYFTRGMQDFAVPLADDLGIACGGPCNGKWDPSAAPPLDGSMMPWPSS